MYVQPRQYKMFHVERFSTLQPRLLCNPGCYDGPSPMPEFCDVALPVPLDIVFTYRIADGMQPVIGGRVLVPFRQQRLSGIAVSLHDHQPKVQTKNVIETLDSEPVL